MSLLGQGAFVAWHGIAVGREADYDRWHSHEHMLERVGILGFLRGRRYIAADDGPRYLVLYEVAHIDVLTSPAYLERLDNPTAWTREVMPAVSGMNRTLCRVEESFGRGIGHAVLSPTGCCWSRATTGSPSAHCKVARSRRRCWRSTVPGPTPSASSMI
jgi:hypothetical protein